MFLLESTRPSFRASGASKVLTVVSREARRGSDKVLTLAVALFMPQLTGEMSNRRTSRRLRIDAPF